MRHHISVYIFMANDGNNTQTHFYYLNSGRGLPRPSFIQRIHAPEFLLKKGNNQ